MSHTANLKLDTFSDVSVSPTSLSSPPPPPAITKPALSLSPLSSLSNSSEEIILSPTPVKFVGTVSRATTTPTGVQVQQVQQVTSITKPPSPTHVVTLTALPGESSRYSIDDLRLDPTMASFSLELSSDDEKDEDANSAHRRKSANYSPNFGPYHYGTDARTTSSSSEGSKYLGEAYQTTIYPQQYHNPAYLPSSPDSEALKAHKAINSYSPEIETSMADERVALNRFAIDERFQAVMELSEATPALQLHKYKQLSQLSADFMLQVRQHGRTIISEMYLPIEDRTIKPVTLKGVAGGTKFVHQGILFKLAVDKIKSPESNDYIYGGLAGPSFEDAQEACGHDLKGAINYYRFHRLGVQVPIQATVDFWGYKLSAMPFLRLAQQSLIYGSDDGGETVHADHLGFNGVMRKVAAQLHLASHIVGGVRLDAAGDIEGHLGENGRVYLLDLARTFPPEHPLACSHLVRPPQGVFYCFLRPEFLQLLKQRGYPPLSPDSLTGWGGGDPARREHAQNLFSATKLLFEDVIPAFAAARDELKESSENAITLRCQAAFHSAGINVRHAGLVRKCFKCPRARQVLLLEMVARVLKNILRRWFRLTARCHPNSEYKIREVLLVFLNLVSKPGPKSADFWNEHVTKELLQKFGDCALVEKEKQNLFAAINEETRDDQLLNTVRSRPSSISLMSFSFSRKDLHQRSSAIAEVIVYVAEMTGVQFLPTCLVELARSPDFEFCAADIASMEPRTKHMSIVNFADAQLLAHQAKLSENSIEVCLRLLNLACGHLQHALQSDPLNDEIKTAFATSEKKFKALQLEVGKEYDQADLTFIQGAREALRRPDAWSLIIANHTLAALIDLWNSRLASGDKTIAGRWGAANQRNLFDLAELLRLWEQTITEFGKHNDQKPDHSTSSTPVRPDLPFSSPLASSTPYSSSFSVSPGASPEKMIPSSMIRLNLARSIGAPTPRISLTRHESILQGPDEISVMKDTVLSLLKVVVMLQNNGVIKRATLTTTSTTNILTAASPAILITAPTPPNSTRTIANITPSSATDDTTSLLSVITAPTANSSTGTFNGIHFGAHTNAPLKPREIHQLQQLIQMELRTKLLEAMDASRLPSAEYFVNLGNYHYTRANNTRLIPILTSVDLKTARTPLFIAVEKESSEFTTFLIREGSDLEYRDLDGNTPFLYACHRRSFKMMSLLARFGANIYAEIQQVIPPPPPPILTTSSSVSNLSMNSSGSTSQLSLLAALALKKITALDLAEAKEDDAMIQHFRTLQQDADKVEHMLEKRTEIVRELLKRIEADVDDLEILVDFFIAGLQRDNFLKKSQMEQIFGNVAEIRTFCLVLLAAIYKATAGDSWNNSSSVSSLFDNVLSHYIRLFPSFCGGINAGLRVLESASHPSLQKALIRYAEQGKQHLEAQKRTRADLSLPTLLEVPRSHLAYLSKTLARVLDFTPTGHSDYAGLQILNSRIHQLHDVATFEAKTVDNDEKVMLIEQQFKANPGFLEPGRFLLKEGLLTKKSRKTDHKCHFFLFTDMMAYATKSFGRLRLHRTIPLDCSFQLQDHPQNDRMFTLVSAHKSFIIVAESAKDKQEWMSTIDQARSALQQQQTPMITPVRPVMEQISEQTECPLCKHAFSWHTRRHHCHSCGTVVCKSCSRGRRAISLDTPERVCSRCDQAPNRRPTNPF